MTLAAASSTFGTCLSILAGYPDVPSFRQIIAMAGASVLAGMGVILGASDAALQKKPAGVNLHVHLQPASW
jgi:hypothetical protein